MSLELRLHADAEAFLAEAIEPLEAAETANNLILGVPLGMRMRPDQPVRDAWFATVHAEGALVGAALRTPPHHAIVHVEEAAAAQGDAILALLLEDALVRAGDLNGVNGRVPWSQRFAEAWAERTGGNPHLVTHMRAYALRAVALPPPAPGVLRKAGAEDFATALEFFVAFHAEAMGNDPGAPDAESVQRRLAAGDIYLWEDDGAPVCLVVKSRPLPHGITLGPIYTPPAARQKGYASACTAAVSQLLLDSGRVYCALFTDLANPVSNSIYQKIGYRAVCDYADFSFTGD